MAILLSLLGWGIISVTVKLIVMTLVVIGAVMLQIAITMV